MPVEVAVRRITADWGAPAVQVAAEKVAPRREAVLALQATTPREQRTLAAAEEDRAARILMARPAALDLSP